MKKLLLTFAFLAVVSPASARTALTSDVTLQVNNVSGCSASGPGTTQAPFCAPQQATDYVRANYDLAGRTVTVSVAAGDYTSFGILSVSGVFTGGGEVIVQGQIGSASSVLVSGVRAGRGAEVSVRWLKMVGAGMCLEAGGAATVLTADNFDCGVNTSAYHINATVHAVIRLAGSYVVSGDAANHYSASIYGVIDMEAPSQNAWSVTFIGTRTFSAVTLAHHGGAVDHKRVQLIGAVIGERFLAHTLGMIHTQGGLQYFPGTEEGRVDPNGSQYD